MGLSDTHFENPHGLDGESHYTTAYELGVIASYALQNDLFARVAKTKNYTFAGDGITRTLTNHNRMLVSYSGAVGVKTGFTKATGRCLVSAVERNGRMLIAVTLDAPDDWNDHEKLYDMGFFDMRVRDIVKAGLVGYANIAGNGQVKLYIEDDIKYCLTPDEIDRIDVTLKGDRIVYGSHKKGDKYGEITVTLDGALICRRDVYFSQDITQKCAKPSLWERIKGVFALG